MDNPRRLFLIRHAETALNRENRVQGGAYWGAPLSKKGEKQARLAGKALKQWYNFSGRYIISSLTQRTQETAQIIQKELQPRETATILISGLNELDYGDWETKLFREVKENYPKEYYKWLNGPCDNFKIPGGDSFSRAQKRVNECFKNVTEDWLKDKLSDNRDMMIVCHGGINQLILTDIIGAPLKKWRKIRQINACINIINFYEENDTYERKIVIDLMNSGIHLSVLT